MRYPRVLVALVLAFFASVAPARTLVWCGTLIDGIVDQPAKEMTVVVDGQRIAAVQHGYATAQPGDTVIDLKAETVTPGWIDCHVHLDMQQSPQSYTEGFFMNPADYALRSTVYARRTLQAEPPPSRLRRAGTDHTEWVEIGRARSTSSASRALSSERLAEPRLTGDGSPYHESHLASRRAATIRVHSWFKSVRPKQGKRAR